MGRGLLTIGSVLLLLTAALWVAGATDVMEGAIADHWSSMSLKAGLIALAAGVLGRLLSYFAKGFTRGRCEVCGKRTLRGHLYCADHLQAAVNATRDEVRERTNPKPRAHAQQR